MSNPSPQKATTTTAQASGAIGAWVGLSSGRSLPLLPPPPSGYADKPFFPCAMLGREKKDPASSGTKKTFFSSRGGETVHLKKKEERGEGEKVLEKREKRKLSGYECGKREKVSSSLREKGGERGKWMCVFGPGKISFRFRGETIFGKMSADSSMVACT